MPFGVVIPITLSCMTCCIAKKATKMLTEVMAWPKVNPLVFIEVNRFLIDKARIGFYQMTIAKSTDWLPQIVSVLTSIVQAMSTGLVHSLHLD